MGKEIAQTVEVQVKLKLADMFRYNMYVAYRSVFSKVMTVIGVALLGFFFYKVNTRTVSLDLFIATNFLWIMLPVLLLVVKPWKVWTITATQMQSPIFSGTSYYTFSPASITLKVGDLEDAVPWETYSQIVETNKDFRFFVDKVQAQLVPKHNLEAKQIEDLRAVIKASNPV
ncbi:MAG: YcxB family protein, partial [Cellulosilyticaceae bacterium]